MTIEDQQTHRSVRSPIDQKEVQQTSPIRTPDKESVCVKEIDGPLGLEPTRYGDWEKNGRCIDF
uniref:DUF1674 domain-containing protein n=1 Tax=Candidatus Kentrum sp. FM TaxID=2126340 RepID=A0A450S344_9GAMM|nr:MAG: Protein of unknown function (DUF1674) [Candidatus Kentron sp. FM]VFJ55692.1 MAG: Protein of unknown function (DUF1674) [Candidatus Kentron sp. FM]VFK06440.1 MAG: Protein of unknown function (DUF1674) [Candidatus Kentron sp. FM]